MNRSHPSSLRVLSALAAALALSPFAGAWQGAPVPRAVTNVSLDRAGVDPARWTILLRDGRIEALQPASDPIPPGMWQLDAEGALALPAFLDAYTRTGCKTPEPRKDQDLPPDERADVGIDMREANRKGVQPAFRAATALAFEQEARDDWQKAGFGVACVAPGGELLAGSGVLATVREAAARDLVVTPALFQHGAFEASGPGYPSTAMGYMAQLRQFFLDARHQRDAEVRFLGGRPGLRPPFDDELEAGIALLAGARRLACHADEMPAIDRWLRLAREFDLSLVLCGGGEALRLAPELAAAGVPVLLTLGWSEEVDDPLAEEEEAEEEPQEEGEAQPDQPDEPDESGDEPPPARDAPETESGEEPAVEEAAIEYEYTEPLDVRVERRRLWLEERDNAIRLHEAGVAIAFGSGQSKPDALLDKVRELVEAGLPAEAALEGLTEGAARILGVGERLGRLAPGRDATFCLWKGDPLTDEKATVGWVFVDGHPREFPAEDELQGKPAKGVDLSGGWTVVFESQGRSIEARLELEMAKDGAVSGSFSMPAPAGGSQSGEVEGHVAGRDVRLELEVEEGDRKIPVALEGKLEGDVLEGKIHLRPPGVDPRVHSFRATREKPERRIQR